MAKTEFPYFAKNQVKFYCDDTEPKLYPDAFEIYVPKTLLDEVNKRIPILEKLASSEPCSCEYEIKQTSHVGKNIYCYGPLLKRCQRCEILNYTSKTGKPCS